MSFTPRTDAAEKECVTDAQLLGFARQLEREIAEARADAKKWESENAANLANIERAVNIGEKIADQRDALAKKANKLEEDREYNAQLCEEFKAQRDALAEALAFIAHDNIANANDMRYRANKALAAVKGDNP